MEKTNPIPPHSPLSDMKDMSIWLMGAVLPCIGGCSIYGLMYGTVPSSVFLASLIIGFGAALHTDISILTEDGKKK